MSYSAGPRRELSSLVKLQIDLTAQMLRVARTSRGWTQREAADRTGVSMATISYVEQGKQVPALDTLLILAEFYGLSFDLRWEREGDEDGD